jgi:tryptophan synthase alpha chain
MDKIQAALRGKKGLVIYITAGFPDYARCEEAILAAVRAGADVIEVGMPFSDPLADGPVLQKAGSDALAAGADTAGTLALIARLRQKTRVPLCIMGYINPIYAYGIERFMKEAKKAGLDGLILPDLPEEEAGLVEDAMAANDLSRIHFIAPTSGRERIREICSKAQSGFVYCLARTGVTGAGSGIDAGAKALVTEARAATCLPLAIGFGISDPVSAREAADAADAVIVGSAVVDALRQGGSDAVGELVSSLRRAIDA